MDRLEPVAMSGRRLPPGIAYLLLFLVFTSTFRVFATLPLETLHQTLSSVAIISLTLYYIGSVYVDLRASRLTWLDVLMWIFILVNFFAAYQGRVVSASRITSASWRSDPSCCRSRACC